MRCYNNTHPKCKRNQCTDHYYKEDKTSYCINLQKRENVVYEYIPIDSDWLKVNDYDSKNITMKFMMKKVL